MSLRLHNTLTRATEPFVSIEPDHVRMYVCGITVYDLCHVGHARMNIVFDTLVRWLRTSGWRVTYVRNITDIDDKIIKRAFERGIPIRQLTDEMTAAMHQDFDALGIARPDHEPRATEHVAGMVGIIETLQRHGLAYQASSGDVNFAVRKFPGYGRLSGKSIDALRAGERVAVLEGKEDPLDFVLWKAAKADEPDDAKYPSPFGAGRPGWHIECSAMSHAHFGAQFDIHGGGMDLQFPHHENELAQSDGAFHHGSDRSFVRFWVHNGFLNVDDEKMSKSLGNFFTVREVLERYDGETIRFFMQRVHYRSPFNFSDAGLDDARAGLRRLYTAIDGLDDAPIPAVDWQEPHAARFKAAMDDDLNTPIAVAVLFDLAGEVNRGRDAKAAGQLRALAGTLGLLGQRARTYLQAGAALDEAQIGRQIEARLIARRAKDFAESDRIRDALAAQGIVLKDGPSGTTWVRA
ncbi:MAG TPA: cysteine--tRNA ligase [Methylibium sp.]|uniref:cysteine--tRNA ligase n=1 Tax=Methylibium sp. TaxID=2067992 RepID=UPI002DBA931A|nr:cysteine--tRNA ligase [Methylibium sp.]HEU4458908.1 cysteine--tRNA ligase [Methylibium sp.]